MHRVPGRRGYHCGRRQVRQHMSSLIGMRFNYRFAKGWWSGHSMGYNGGEKRDTMLGAERRSHHPRRDFLSVLSLRIWWLCMLRGERKALFDSCVYLTFRTYHLTTFVYNKRVPFHFISSDSQSRSFEMQTQSPPLLHPARQWKLACLLHTRNLNPNPIQSVFYDT